MEAAKLRHRVKLQRVTVAADTHGDQTKTWTTLDTIWASIEPISGREFLQASQVMSDVTARIKMRGRNDITLTPKDRVRFVDPVRGERLFDIRQSPTTARWWRARTKIKTRTRTWRSS